ncbi:MAG TPA: hypothetical protein VGM91_09015 [Conexibacter sp.]|jgi:hypothetical protein
MRLVPLRAPVGALVAVLLSCAFASSAQAFAIPDGAVNVGPRVPTGTEPVGALPSRSAAGAHPVMDITIPFDDVGDPTADSVDSVSIHLAPGVVAYVDHVPACTTWDATTPTRTGCPDSVVGSTSTSVTAQAVPPIVPVASRLPLTLPGTIYRIPSPDPVTIPAAFGIEIPSALGGAPIKLVSPITVDPHDLGLTAKLSGLPNTAEIPMLGTIPIHVDRVTQTLFGYTSRGGSFFTNPTSCIPAPITVTATSHGGQTTSGSGTYTPTDCDRVPFDVSLATTAEPATADSTSAISFDVKPSANDVPLATSHVRTTTVIAPPGVLLNPALAARLDACTDAGFAQSDTAVAANCPASSEVGSIEFVSPILGPFPGKVYFGTQTPTDRLRLFLDVPLFGAHIKVSATVNPDYTTGQVTTVFSELPQIAFTDFRLTFNGGPQSALVTPTTCGENVSTAIVGPWSGGPVARPQGSFTTTDCSRAFSPSMTTAVSTPQAGASPAFTLTYDRPDRTVPVGRVAFNLPPGLLGSLALRGLTKCPLSVAATGGCPGSSRVGSVQAVVGSGGEPPTLPGSAYLTEPRQAGDIAGLLVVVPAKLGPVDAGTVIVGERLVLGNDGHLDVISDPIPALQLGIPLAIRRLTVTIDRDGFMRNPTSCGTKQANGTFTPLDGGPDAGASSTLDINGCDRLPFAPSIATTIGGRGATKLKTHPALTVRIAQSSGQAAMRSAVVTLPRSLSTNLETLRHICDPALVSSFRCPTASYVANATAVSPLIERPLTGQVHLVRVGTGLPKLVVQLRGEASIDLDGPITINRTNQIVTTFASIPDVTLSSFTLAFRGPHGVLTTIGDLCTQSTVVAAFSGQNGKSTSAKPRLSLQGCTRPTASGSLKMRGGRGTLKASVKVPKGGKPLASVKLTLSKGLSASGAKLTAKAAGKRVGKRAVKAKGRTITVKLPKRGARSLVLTARGVSAGSPRVARRLALRRGKATLVVGARQTDNARTRRAVKLKLR